MSSALPRLAAAAAQAAAANATKIGSMKPCPDARQRPAAAAGTVAEPPAIDTPTCGALSLAIDGLAPSDEVQTRILQRVLRAVGKHPEKVQIVVDPASRS